MISWLHKTFSPYCKAQGIDILPDDLKFIERCISSKSEPVQREIMREYFNVWRGIVKEHPKQANIQNMGRKESNEYLRRITTKN